MKTLLIFATLLSFHATADWTRMPSDLFLLPPPPEQGSEEFERDFRILFEEQHMRTEEQCELASRQKFPDFQVFFKNNGILTEDETDRAEELGKKVLKLTERISVYNKKKHQRPRPYDVDPRIRPCIARPEGSKSYPSSHAAEAAVGACILAEIYPDRAGALIEYGRDLGFLRVTVGVHHPSDVEAGQQLAQDICARLLREPDFRREIKALKDQYQYEIAN